MFGTSGFVVKLNVQKCGNSTRNCVCYMYVMSGFAEKLNVQNSINSRKNSVHYMYGMFRFEENFFAIAAQIILEIMYIIRT